MGTQIIKGQNVLKTFVFEKEETQQSTIFDYQIDMSAALVDLNPIFSVHCALEKHKISIYDPNHNRFVSIKKISQNNGFIHQDYLEPKVILFRYSKNNEHLIDSDSLDSSIEYDHDLGLDKKDARSKERTISEVIELVKKWRNLHLYGHKTINRRVNLQDAAKLVGVSKKTLDDYYCQLRLGQFYEFDFATKLQQKIGALRSYVKEYKPEKQSKRRQNEKHPKHLKTKSLKICQNEMMEGQSAGLQSFNGINRQTSIEIPKIQIQQEPNQVLSQVGQNQPESQQIFQQLYNAQNQFFKGFDYPLEEPQDPFFQIQRDFYKKPYEEDSNNSFFYF